MLAVITDDFTGASEIAGIALAKGYRTVIETQTVSQSDADVLVIASNMRSLDTASAVTKSAELTKQILALKPDLIFKKVDSVLRGNVGPELEAQMKAEAKPHALLVPANPSLRRTIVDGIYYVGDSPIAKSVFAKNYNFSSDSSKVTDILRNRGAKNAVSISLTDEFVADGVHIGNAGNAEDLRNWAGRINGQTIPAGAADFFSAILDSRAPGEAPNEKASAAIELGRALYVCGSNFPSSQKAVTDAAGRGLHIVAMPDEIYYNHLLDSASLERWAQQVLVAFEDHKNVAIAALQEPENRSLSGLKITQALAAVARRAVVENRIDDLMIEGGSTAHALMSALNINKLLPVEALAAGVTRMKVEIYPNLHVTMKPGSYRWPTSIWNVNNQKVK
jgi:uncharacterized protein YgbK (DUF1537 family)